METKHIAQIVKITAAAALILLIILAFRQADAQTPPDPSIPTPEPEFVELRDFEYTSNYVCYAKTGVGYEFVTAFPTSAEAEADCSQRAKSTHPDCNGGVGYPWCGLDHKVESIAWADRIWLGEEPVAPSRQILYGPGTPLDSGLPLDGASVQGAYWVYTYPDVDTDQVKFYIDGVLERTEGATPFCLGPSPCTYDFSQLIPGTHEVRAVVIPYPGEGTEEEITATFTVLGNTPPPTSSRLNWSAPTTNEEGEVLQTGRIQGYDVYRNNEFYAFVTTPPVEYPAVGCWKLKTVGNCYRCPGDAAECDTVDLETYTCKSTNFSNEACKQ